MAVLQKPRVSGKSLFLKSCKYFAIYEKLHCLHNSSISYLFKMQNGCICHYSLCAGVAGSTEAE